MWCDLCSKDKESGFLLLGEGGVFVFDIDDQADVDRCGSSTVQFEFTDPYNR